MRGLCSLDPPPSQAQRIISYKMARHFAQDSQHIFSYLLPVGGTAEDILRDLVERVVSPQAGMRAKKLEKVLQA